MASARCRYLVCLLMILATHGAAGAQMLPAGPQVLTFRSDVDDTEQPYAIYIPPNFDETRRYPLVISLHGAGSNHRLNLQRVFGKTNAPGETDVEASREFAAWEDRDYLVASPYARGTMGYQGVAEKDVLDVLADVKQRFPVDEDRVYLTGLSMGGGGTLWLGLSRPDLWAAIAPVCPAPPRGLEALAANASNLPVHFFHGAADPVVPVEVSREWVERLRAVGARVEYAEYEGVGHDSWDPAYADGRIFDWFDRFERNRFPERVRFSTDRYETDRAYWLVLDALTPGTLASIDAQFTSENEIEVTTSQLDGFTLTLAGHPKYSVDDPVHVTVDGTVIQVEGDVVSFSRSNDQWQVGMAERRAAPVKRKGTEGPMSRAVADRHVYVYGTLAADEPSIVAERYATAVEAGTWSIYRGSYRNRVMVFPRIISDREVRPSDITGGNLVLLGTRATNRILSDLAPELPMHLVGDSTRYGLAYIYPNDDRYVVVSSGVPWWHAPIERIGWTFADEIPALRLSDQDDFILFDRQEDRVLAAGRFDNQWRLPPEAAAALLETGVVTLADE